MPPDAPAVVVATSIEAKAARRHLPQSEIVEAGIALVRLPSPFGHSLAISCGLAGGLRDDLPTGTVVIPSTVATAHGKPVACDRAWTQRLKDAATRMGHTFVDLPLLTSERVISGGERSRWASQGYAAVDMETALLPVAFAAVRVILDTPRNELSPDWVQPARALLRLRNWKQLPFLAREGPRCADLAARIVAAALVLRS
ncbi:MAG TPA: hypothetical protein VMD47_00875 [Candidatus Acidoferrales bacterium]|nr:hypothetical protein [Candidatus Acidoferrales bacterium]